MASIAEASKRIFLEPLYITESYVFIFVDFWQIVAYNFVWSWEVLDGTFQFGTEGIEYGAEMIF